MSELDRNLGQERLMVAHLVNPIDEGDQFENWPLHITILPWFHRVEPIAKAEIGLAAEHMRACRISLGQKALGSVLMFGNEYDIPVRPIRDSTSLGVMHGMLLSMFHENLEDIDFIGGAYNPHLTIRDNDDPGENSMLNVDSISIIRYGKPRKTVIGNYSLKK